MIIREAQKVINELNLICNEVHENGTKRNYHYWYPFLVAFVLVCKQENSVVYRRYFSDPPKDDYQKNKIPMPKSRFYQFMYDIKNTKLEEALDFLKKDHFGKYCLLQIINSFSYIKNIETKDLADYFETDLKQVEEAVESERFAFPDRINIVIRNVKTLNI